ncbi:multidrug effflux MFS transporter [Bradyrhizobium sp. LHD-71]|uniref:multidrug effflux MFS transporter n=1 Tax=Bradyrhizobium sp. LHD-71 TaxID=3072141 RepID=UPI00280D1CDD|nr:multidrug effflux MFS transporter [Bradyrhizobium sp. LHD-71]MDQ8727825.1 multidrug effflux MFS transporter [Bradyrhizobium sp. LHD-71]
MTDDTLKADSAASKAAATPATGVPAGFLVLLIAMSGLGPMSMQAIMPALPALAAYFREDIAVAQLTISLYLVGLACSQLVVGPLSDKFGRRPVILAGLLLMVVSNAAGIFAETLPQVIAARIVQALGAASGLAVGRAMIRDLYDRDRAASMIGIVVGSMMIAPMIGPFFGGVLETVYGWRAIFWFLGAVSLLVFLWACVTLPETRRAPAGPGPAGFLSDVRALIASPQYHGFVIAQALAAATFFIFASGGAYVAIIQMGRSSAEYGAWFALGSIAYMAGNLTSARLTPKLGGHRMIWIGLVMQIAGSALNLTWGLAGLNTDPAWFFVTQMIVAYGNGYVMSNVAAGAVSVRPQAAGTASGVLGFVQMGFGAIVSQVGAHLGGDYATTVPLNLAGLILSLLCAAVVAVLISRYERR